MPESDEEEIVPDSGDDEELKLPEQTAKEVEMKEVEPTETRVCCLTSHFKTLLLIT